MRHWTIAELELVAAHMMARTNVDRLAEQLAVPIEELVALAERLELGRGYKPLVDPPDAPTSPPVFTAPLAPRSRQLHRFGSLD